VGRQEESHQPPQARNFVRDGARIFDDPNLVSHRDRMVDDEERWHTIGCAGDIAIVLVVHTSEEQHGEEKIRIVSARKASPRERALYHATQ
jgi:hypothetical protein